LGVVYPPSSWWNGRLARLLPASGVVYPPFLWLIYPPFFWRNGGLARRYFYPPFFWRNGGLARRDFGGLRPLELHWVPHEGGDYSLNR